MVLPILVIAGGDDPVYAEYKKEKIERFNSDKRFCLYFLYGGDSSYRVQIADNIYDVYVDVEESNGKGCSLKFLYTLRELEGIDYVIRINITNIISPDRLYNAIMSLPQTSPILSGRVFNGMAFGPMMIWNKSAIERIISSWSLNFIERFYTKNSITVGDDVALTLLSLQNGIVLDTSLTDRIIETEYTFYYDPPCREDWIMKRRPRNEFRSRYTSDLYSLGIKMDVDAKEEIMYALDFMDKTGRTQYMQENLDILFKNWIMNVDPRHHGVIIYYLLKYGRTQYIEKVLSLENYRPDDNFKDVYFYLSIIENRIPKDLYHRLKTKASTFREKQ